ncbi:Alpha/Beta hydrolase protein [Mycena albidolilacea]|uniref:Carboxylic ester hydrolase n=1 Tax=Mycena albidolilacea TaxID=1033008 RepID=A0AAD6ZIB6_9AGAR|nr:Alpha/Beta hydrolase protein [Mycena albidolilacea]
MSPFPSLRVTLSYILFFIASVVAGPPTISLSYGTFQGLSDGNLTKFLGVPFAQSCVLFSLSSLGLTELNISSSGRFEVLKAPGLLHGLQNATAFGPACPQQALTPLPIPFASAPYPSISENCHTLDIFKPSSPGSGYRLPVFIWLYDGAFEVGNSRDTDVSLVVERSVQTGEPIIIVIPNYRLSAFGFLAGREVHAAGVTNLGFPPMKIPSEIFALEWVQKYISAFGGDPNRVVIGGQSAGARSTALLLLSNNRNSNALFCKVFMESGSTIGSPSPAVLQSHYDALVAANNCSADTETLSCLRRVPFDSFMATVNRTAGIFRTKALRLCGSHTSTATLLRATRN